jgi:septation ring formation regulator EzrA
MKNLLFLIIFLSTLLSCADLNRDKFLGELTQLDHKLEEIEAMLKEAQLNEVSTIKNNTMQTELRVKQNLYLDTIDMKLAKQLDAFKVMRRSVKPLMQQYTKIKQGVKEEKQVLKRLRMDINDGRGERQRYAEYIRFERQKVKQLQLLSKDFLRAKDHFFKDYERLYPPVEAFSRTLLRKNQQR